MQMMARAAAAPWPVCTPPCSGIIHTNAGHDARRPQHHPVLSALSADDADALLHTPVVVVTCDGQGNLLKQVRWEGGPATSSSSN